MQFCPGCSKEATGSRKLDVDAFISVHWYIWVMKNACNSHFYLSGVVWHNSCGCVVSLHMYMNDDMQRGSGASAGGFNYSPSHSSTTSTDCQTIRHAPLKHALQRVELSSSACLHIEYVPLENDTPVKQSPSHPALSSNQTQQVQVWNKRPMRWKGRIYESPTVSEMFVSVWRQQCSTGVSFPMVSAVI